MIPGIICNALNKSDSAICGIFLISRGDSLISEIGLRYNRSTVGIESAETTISSISNASACRKIFILMLSPGFILTFLLYFL